MFTTVDAISEGASYDLIVIGSGAAGMSAALFAAIEGRKVLRRRAHRICRRHQRAVGGVRLDAELTPFQKRQSRRQPREGSPVP